MLTDDDEEGVPAAGGAAGAAAKRPRAAAMSDSDTDGTLHRASPGAAASAAARPVPYHACRRTGSCAASLSRSSAYSMRI